MLELPSSDANDPTIVRLDASGGTVAMDHLGPIVVNTDGSLTRITSWDQLSDHERSVAWRRVAKRNAERLEALRSSNSKTEN